MQVLMIPYLGGLLIVGILRASRSLSYTSGSVVLANISRARAHACKKPARDLSFQSNAIVCAFTCSALQRLGAEYVWAHVGNLFQAIVLRYTCDTRMLACYSHALASFSSRFNLIYSRKRLSTAIQLSTRIFSPSACSSAQTLMAFKWANGEFLNGDIMRPATAYASFLTSASTRVSAPLATLCLKSLQSYVPSLFK
jgi:hypothetical protein